MKNIEIQNLLVSWSCGGVDIVQFGVGRCEVEVGVGVEVGGFAITMTLAISLFTDSKRLNKTCSRYSLRAKVWPCKNSWLLQSEKMLLF